MGACIRAENLGWLHSAASGTEHPVFDVFRSRGVTVTNTAGGSAPSIAQTVMTYLLALGRNLPQVMRNQAEQHWDPAMTAVDLDGMRLGIVGLGEIGSHTARLALALGMQVIGLRRRVRGDEPCETWTDDRFHELLGWADVIAVTAPLTPATRSLFDADAFSRMRRGSWFVNVGRGEIVDEDALVANLVAGHLGGAGLDVFVTEPLPGGHPLWSLPNVIVTPHSSGNTTTTTRRTIDRFLENFRRHSAGEPLIGVTGPGGVTGDTSP
jgi:phosphoglycerate dehydrogenase-like enzyme